MDLAGHSSYWDDLVVFPISLILSAFINWNSFIRKSCPFIPVIYNSYWTRQSGFKNINYVHWVLIKNYYFLFLQSSQLGPFVFLPNGHSCPLHTSSYLFSLFSFPRFPLHHPDLELTIINLALAPFIVEWYLKTRNCNQCVLGLKCSCF